MATTTNYGWTTPDDTALVKDGASAIRTLGSSVDTTTKNLNPETTLGDLSFRSSTSNVNTRIPIGSSGQHLTVVAGVPAWATASDQTPLTTKGDLLGFSTLDARIPIGTDGHILTADSTESLGLKWAAPAAGSTFAGCSLYKTGSQTLSNATATALTFDAENFDTNAYHNDLTNTSRITIPAGKAGYYLFNGSITYGGNTSGVRNVLLYKNTVQLNIPVSMAPTSSGVARYDFSYTVYLDVADYVELYGSQSSGGDLNVTSGTTETTFSASFLGA